MKSLHIVGIGLFSWALWSCNQTNETNSEMPDEAKIQALHPLESTKAIFESMIAHYDSVSTEESDSTFSYYAIPKSEDYDPEKDLYGAFTIDKKSMKLGDMNGDGLDDVLVQYSFTPHLENNSLNYFKVLVQENGKLKEVGQIFGGGRCEGPILMAKEIKNNVIYFEGLEYNSGDPCCCPSIKSVFGYKFENGKLIEVEKKVL